MGILRNFWGKFSNVSKGILELFSHPGWSWDADLTSSNCRQFLCLWIKFLWQTDEPEATSLSKDLKHLLSFFLALERSVQFNPQWIFRSWRKHWELAGQMVLWWQIIQIAHKTHKGTDDYCCQCKSVQRFRLKIWAVNRQLVFLRCVYNN